MIKPLSEESDREELESVCNLRDKARRRILEALDRGEMDEVIRLARVTKDFDIAMRSAEATKNRLSSELDPEGDGSARGTQMGVPNFGAGVEHFSNKAWGNKTRREWVQSINVRNEGIRLRSLKGAKYETKSGKRIGIACARERDQ